MRADPAMGVGGGAARRRSSACSTAPGTTLPAEVAHPFFWAPFAVIGDGGGGAGGAPAQQASLPPPAGL